MIVELLLLALLMLKTEVANLTSLEAATRGDIAQSVPFEHFRWYH